MEGGRIDPSIATVIDEPPRSMDLSDRYFLFNQKILSLAGLWYTQSYKERLVRYYIVGSMSFYSVFSELCQIFALNLDLQTAVRILQVLLPAVCAAIIYGTCIFHFITLQKMYSYVQHDWQQLKDDTELKIMQKHSHLSKFFTMTIALMFYVYLTTSIFPSLQRIILTSNEIRSDLDFYPIISCIDYISNRRTYYYPIIMCQIGIAYVLGSLAICSFSMHFAFIHHACAWLYIIKYRISYPFISNDRSQNDPVVLTDRTHWIIDIAQSLVKTKEYVALVNKTTEKCYLVQIFLAYITLIMDFLCLFQIPVLLEHKEGWKHVVELIFFICGTLYLLYINCYIGQSLIDHSMDVYREACIVPIHELSLKTQKLLLTTLMISAKPCTFSVHQVYVASHVFFSSILRSSLSFAMVVHSLQRV